MPHDLFKYNPHNPFEINVNQIYLWQMSLEQPPDNAFELLSDDEKQRALRFHFPKHQRRFIAARATMRILLGKYLNEQPESLRFTYNKHGKPYLMDQQDIQFNISDSRDHALLAVNKTFDVGIDIEFFSQRPYLGIADHLFSPIEKKALSESSEAMKPLVFFNIWAQKEAFIKACGLGLSYPTKTFDVEPFHNADTIIYNDHTKSNWRIVSFMPKPACCAALCFNPSITEIFYNDYSNP